MRKYRYVAAAYVCLALLILPFTVSAQEKAVEGKAAPAAAAVTASGEKAPEMTRDEILKNLKAMLQNRPEIAIEGLQPGKDASGAQVFLYQGKDIDELDKDALMALLRNVNQQVSWKSYENLQRQLRAMKQIEDMNRAQRAVNPARNYTPAGVPRTPGTTQVPKTYTAPKTTK